MLGLLDQDQATVEGTIPILQTLAALPLENPATRRECLQLLSTLEQRCASPTKAPATGQSRPLHDLRFDAASDVPTSENDRLSDTEDAMPPSFVYEYDDKPPRLSLWSLSSLSSDSSSSSSAMDSATVKTRGAVTARDSGRVKSLSLHHCKEFLLACANEIHELDSENPNFDYAEETSSETSGRHTAPASTAITRAVPLVRRNRPSLCTTECDYASTVPSSSCASIATAFDHDDVEADQGSEFSEVLRRADYMSDFGDGEDNDDDDGVSSHASWTTDSPREQEQKRAIRELDNVRSRVLCRQVLRQLHAAARTSATQRSGLALQRRVFTALKQHGRHAASQRRAFERMKMHAQQMRLKRTTMKKLRVATWQRAHHDAPASPSGVVSPATALRAKMLVAQHLDLVFVALCAAFLHATVSGA